MKRASYQNAVRWISEHDGDGDDDIVRLNWECVEALDSVTFVADLFGVETERVAQDVVTARIKMDRTKRTENSK